MEGPSTSAIGIADENLMEISELLDWLQKEKDRCSDQKDIEDPSTSATGVVKENLMEITESSEDDFDDWPLEEDPSFSDDDFPYVFRDFSEVINFNSSNQPSNKKLKLVGKYCYISGTHVLCEVSDNSYKIRLDMSKFDEKYPVIDSYVEVFAVLVIHKGRPAILVKFYISLGYNLEVVFSYIKYLKRLRHMYEA